MPRSTPHSEETKQKIREAHLGRKVSEESRILMSLASRGKPKSEAHKQAMKDAKRRKREAREAAREAAKLLEVEAQ